MKLGSFEIKGCTTYRGHEGESCLQGNLYFDEKKVGSFNEDSWSGEFLYELNGNIEEKELENAARAYFEENKFGCPLKPSDYDMSDLYKDKIIEGMIVELREFYLLEKIAKKTFKKNYEFFVVVKKTKNSREEYWSCSKSHIADIKKENEVSYFFTKATFGLK